MRNTDAFVMPTTGNERLIRKITNGLTNHPITGRLWSRRLPGWRTFRFIGCNVMSKRVRRCQGVSSSAREWIGRYPVAAASPLFHRCSPSTRSRRSLSPAGASSVDRRGAPRPRGRSRRRDRRLSPSGGRGHAPAPRPRCPPSRAPRPGSRRPPLQHILELPHVAGPRILHQAAHRLRGDDAPRAPPLPERLKDVIDQQGDVLPALAQRRNDKGITFSRSKSPPGTARRASLPSAPGSWRRSRERPPAGSCCSRRARIRGPAWTRSSFTWRAGEISPISSRKIVPPSAASNRPTLSATAPVKACFT